MASAAEKGLPKKHYEPPVLTIYGSVQRLTQATLAKRGMDSGSFPTTHTGV